MGRRGQNRGGLTIHQFARTAAFTHAGLEGDRRLSAQEAALTPSLKWPAGLQSDQAGSVYSLLQCSASRWTHQSSMEPAVDLGRAQNR